MHLYSNFSIRRQMAPVQSIKFQTANFPIFCTRIIVIFWTTCIARGVFSLVIMGNVTHILPVLQWLEVVIAFVSSFVVNLSTRAACVLLLGTMCWTTFYHTRMMHGQPDFGASTLADCHSDCVKYTACKGFDWDPENSPWCPCWLHDSYSISKGKKPTPLGVTHVDLVRNCI